ncbi:mannosyl-oligosaccharide glucosidase [Galendromus occidentalis]|uniref:Mannosyl-oligosaccharide glucosidase n=1 Tax=Galendromus occidentalis TaxID=34638 RepID=A0AAJ7L465_9ACAR|nr:mannosyl-oligosaccharide glucosidase [Galendromus occidentalis]
MSVEREENYPPIGKIGLWDSKFKLFMGSNVLIFAVVIGYLSVLHQKEADVITPLNAPHMVTKSGLAVPERYWGSYRSNLYFGMKNRHPDPLNFGLMWFNQKPSANSLNVRHWCSQRDGLQRYSWLKHDGVNFGEQTIIDGNLNITTSFVKRRGLRGGEWTARISVEPVKVPPPKVARDPEPMSLFFYAMADIETHNLSVNLIEKTRVESIQGSSPDIGRWRLRFLGDGNDPMKYSYLSTVVPGPEDIIETLHRTVRAVKLPNHPVKLFFLEGKVFIPDDPVKEPNFVTTQVTVTPPYTMEVLFQNVESDLDREIDNELQGEVYTKELELHKAKFDAKFDSLFHLKEKYKPEDVQTAKAVLSNMVGSIGYFHGRSLVKGPDNREVVLYWPASLYTAVPSRSFFPRGFLWDEGFHNLLISKWNPEISKDIISHWLDLMNKNGWIPREQILGEEAKAAVPREFIVQRSTNANPPTLFLAVQTLLNMMKAREIPDDLEFVRRAYPRLQAIYEYFEREQNGVEDTTYRWRGRDPDARTELNPKTLASGLDDFPRASHPTDEERHIDLRCWVALMAEVLADIGQKLELPESLHKQYREKQEVLSNNDLLNKLHWSEDAKQYSDYGLHTDDVMLVKQKSKPGEPPLPMVRYTIKAPRKRFVNQLGYVSLFPLIMRLLDPDSPQLREILQGLDDPKTMWTDYGLRSLSQTSKLYNTRNTEHDPPYWRGNIWININFLVIRGLRHYATIDGPHKALAGSLCDRLRANVVNNVLKEYSRTGFIWENYDDFSGKGHGSHPFTGWSALVVLLMGEQY